MKPSKVSYQEPYSDGSGTRIGVSWDSSDDGTDGTGCVEIQCLDKISVNLSDIDWLIDALQLVRTTAVSEAQ